MVHVNRRITWLALAGLLISTVAIVMAVVVLGAGPSEAACKAAMVKAFDAALTGAERKPAGFPAECEGISQRDLEKLAAEVLAGK
jgi:NhaP-type Na+/H+ or K+/H+ antiporter